MRAEDCGDRGAAGAARGEHLGQARGHVPGQGPKAGARDWPARTPILGGRSRAPGVAVLIPVGHPVPNPRMRPSSSYGQPGSALLRGLGVSALPPSSPPWGERLGEKGGVSVSARRAVLLPLSAPDSSLQHPRFPAPPRPAHTQNLGDPQRRGGQPCFPPAGPCFPKLPSSILVTRVSPEGPRGVIRGAYTCHFDPQGGQVTALPAPSSPAAPTHTSGPQDFCPHQKRTDS